MDYEFRRDSLSGRCRAIFSMGHEAFGHWLNDEIQTQLPLIDQLLNQIPSLPHQGKEFRLVGSELQLTLTADDARIDAHCLLNEVALEESLDELDYYDDELSAACGLDDFEQMLRSWRHFIVT